MAIPAGELDRSRQDRFATYLDAARDLALVVSGREHQATVLLAQRNGRLVLHAPTSVLPDLVEGRDIEGRFFRENDASYHFRGEIVGVWMDRHANVALRWPDAIERVQSRRHVRLPIVLPAQVAVAGPAKESGPASGPKRAGQPWADGTVLDLSGGGMHMVLSARIPVASTVMVRTAVPTTGHDLHINARAEVVRASTPDSSGPTHYGLRFVDLTEAEEDQIVRAVFHNLTQNRVR